MEFFKWVSVSQAIASLFQSNVETIDEYIAECTVSSYVGLAVGTGIFLIFLIFGGIGLSAMAKREGIKRPYLGYLPFANTYYAGKIAGESNFFGQKMKRAGLYAMLAEIACFILDAFYLAADFVSIPYYEITVVTDSGTYVQPNVTAMPPEISWLVNGQLYFYWLGWLFSFVELIFLCVLFMALFRKYYARSPVLMTVLCALFPFRGIVLFSVRNNKPVDYNDYLRRKAEQFARNSQPHYDNGHGGYGGGYGNGTNGGSSGAPDPFEEFGGSSGSSGSSGPDDNPFSDF